MLWDLARRATALRVRAGQPLELHEATAALQDLATRPAESAAQRTAELAALLAGVPHDIQTQPNGPYLVTNAEKLLDWLGARLPVGRALLRRRRRGGPRHRRLPWAARGGHRGLEGWLLPDHGTIALLDGKGEEVPRNEGASREHYALCRCGHSQSKPFCSGMHWSVGFRDPVVDPDRTPTLFEWCGGLPALTRMTRLFYERHVPQDPMLAPVFADMSADHPERVAKWLGEIFGGPPCYSGEYGGYPRMLSQHVGKCLTEEWRERWVALLLRSAREAGLPNDAEFRSAFQAYIEWGSRLAVENSQTHARPPEHMPMPRWDWNTAAGAPGGRASAPEPAPEEEDAPVVLPAADEPVRFEKHVKPLFRARDRNSMRFAFDLWSYEDVKEHADAILERVRNGTMPCDVAWPEEQVEVFVRSVDAGRPG